jgi:sugar-specific transcriptional regulator TrmB
MYPVINPGLVRNLEKLGLTENEGKAYAGLVSLKEATAREVHELTGVPRAKVYDILKTLSRKGFVEVRQGSPVYFRAVDPKHVIGRIKNEFFTCAIEALDQLNELSYEIPRSSPVWCIQSEWGIRKRVRELLNNVRDELIVFSTNPEFLGEFESDLKKLEKNCRLILIVDDLIKFSGMPFDFTETGKDFGDFVRNMFIDGVQYTEDCFMIADGKESIAVHTAGNNREAVVIRLPVVCHLQKLIYNWLVEGSFIIDTHQ